jgi:hypothetical protein
MTGKIATLGLLFLFLCAGLVLSDDERESLPEILFYEESLFSDEFLFYEELFLFGELFPSEGPLSSDEPLSPEESILSEESFPSDESLITEESTLAEDHSLSEESLLSEDLSPPEEYLLSEESDPLDDSSLSDEDELLLSEGGGLVFEAPTLIYEVPHFVYETRSFDAVFPGFSRREKVIASSKDGLKYSFEKDGSPMIIPASDSGIDLFSSVMLKNPSHLIETLVLVPYNEKKLDILDIYNALGRIENLKDHSFSINDRNINIFEETTRIESARNRRSIPDPPPADTLPYAETMYLRFKDAYYGNLYIRGDVSMSLYGITYSMTNFTDIRYFLVPIIKAERIIITMYLEPVKEGVLIYSISGLYLPGFITDRVNLTPFINRRVTALISWITDGLRKQESIIREREGD